MGGSESKAGSENSDSGRFGPITLADVFVRMWVDVQDKDGKWFEAQIIQVDDSAKSIRVHFKGFLSKWDETITEKDFDHRVARINSRTTVKFQIAPIKGEIGESVDVIDTKDTWMEGRIVDTDKRFGLVKVSYIGWGPRWDEWLHLNSYRIAPANHRSKVDSRARDRQFRKWLSGSMQIHEMNNDGNCLFRAVSHQLYGSEAHHAIIRAICCTFMGAHRHRFVAFVAGDFDEYLNRMRKPGTWGDQPELAALSEIYERPIWLYSVQEFDPPLIIGGNQSANYPICLSYHLNSHYNSIIIPNGWFKLADPPGIWEATVQSNLEVFPEPGGGHSNL